jgi:hypothetical protein
MERRKALAVAAASTLALGGAVIATASLTGASFLGFGGTHHAPHFPVASGHSGPARVITRYRDEYTEQVVEPVVSTGTVSTPPTTTMPPLPAVTSVPPSHESDDGAEPESPPPPRLTATTTTSTSIPSTTTTTVPHEWHDVTDDCGTPPCPDD